MFCINLPKLQGYIYILGRLTSQLIDNLFKPKLSDKQMEILKYIIKNPNQTENRIVMAFKGTYARETVLKTIKFLSDNKIIKIKIINNNQHEIIPNSKNFVTDLIQDLEMFEE